jgi:hypothetical protein
MGSCRHFLLVTNYWGIQIHQAKKRCLILRIPKSRILKYIWRVIIMMKTKIHTEFKWENLAEDATLDEVDGRNGRFWHLHVPIYLYIISGHCLSTWVSSFCHQAWGRKFSYSSLLENITMNLTVLGNENGGGEISWSRSSSWSFELYWIVYTSYLRGYLAR